MNTELIDRCRQGDREAQREVYDLTSAKIYRMLLRMAGNQDDAFDLAQSTYVRAFSHLDQFDHKSSLETWLYRIALNEALGLRRRAEQIRIHQRKIAENLDPRSDGHQFESIDVRECLATLGTEDRAILLLRYQEGFDYRTIAQILAVPEGTVASRLNRARQKLRLSLGEGYDSQEEAPADKHQTKRAGRRGRLGLADGTGT